MAKEVICVVCGKSMNPDAGFYNPPTGPHCSKCWKEVPEKTKRKLISDSLARRVEMDIRLAEAIIQNKDILSVL